MRTTTALLFTFIFTSAFSQAADTTALSGDTTAASSDRATVLDSAALWALDDRLAKLDSEHVFAPQLRLKLLTPYIRCR